MYMASAHKLLAPDAKGHKVLGGVRRWINRRFDRDQDGADRRLVRRNGRRRQQQADFCGTEKRTVQCIYRTSEIIRARSGHVKVRRFKLFKRRECARWN